MFTANRKGFSITFANGITASVQFGKGNYCDNRFKEDDMSGLHSCVNAEIMAYDEDNDEVLNPQSHQSPEEVLKWLNDLSIIINKKDLVNKEDNILSQAIYGFTSVDPTKAQTMERIYNDGYFQGKRGVDYDNPYNYNCNSNMNMLQQYAKGYVAGRDETEA